MRKAFHIRSLHHASLTDIPWATLVVVVGWGISPQQFINTIAKRHPLGKWETLCHHPVGWMSFIQSVVTVYTLTNTLQQDQTQWRQQWMIPAGPIRPLSGSPTEIRRWKSALTHLVDWILQQKVRYRDIRAHVLVMNFDFLPLEPTGFVNW